MAFFEWDKSLDVEVELMNQEHQTLIGLMEALYQKNEAGASKQELITQASELVNYVIKHFKDEENYMQVANFPGLETHKKLHNNLMVDLNKLVMDFVNGANEKISVEFVMFLKMWLFTHIRGIDTKYKVLATR